MIEINLEGDSFRWTLHKLFLEAQDRLLVSVLREYLQRDPVVEDFKRCTRIVRDGYTMSYELAYDSELLGTVDFGFGFKDGVQDELKLNFTPKKCP